MGQESLALFFWGQPNQTEYLDEVPLDHFQEVIDWIDANVQSPKPLIVAGRSKGAEYTANLLPRYDRIDHAILVAPASYSLGALSPQFSHSSWTYQGQPVPHLDWSLDTSPEGQQLKGLQSIGFLLNRPMANVKRYEGVLAAATEDARIRIEDSKATIHTFAGDADQLWPSAQMANQLKETNPEQVQVTIYPGAGHAPGAQRYVAGLDLGGTDDANAAAGIKLSADIAAQLDAWAPQES